MPKQIKRNPCPPPNIDDFIRLHGGKELVSYAKAGEILSIHPKTVGRMVKRGKLSGLAGKTHIRAIYSYLWPNAS